MTNKINRRAFLGTLMGFGAMCAIEPVHAFGVTAAEKQAEVQSVKAQLDAMAEEVSAAGDRYHQAADAYETATAKVEECKATIKEMSDKISTLQEHLKVRATSMYRTGQSSYLDVLLGSSSFGDFASTWDTLNELNADDADLVTSTKVARSTLESAKVELDAQQKEAADQLASSERYMNQVTAKQNEYDNLYNSLSAEYQQLLAEEEAAEAAASARAQQAAGSGSYTQDAPGQPEAGEEPTSSGGGASSSVPSHGGVLDYAYSRLGCAYIWGASGPDAFDCSGLVAWCYAKIGISLPHYTESMYACASARVSPNEARPGDVLYKPGHVGLSLGGISCIEAMGSRWGVVESCRGGWTAALRF